MKKRDPSVCLYALITNSNHKTAAIVELSDGATPSGVKGRIDIPLIGTQGRKNCK